MVGQRRPETITGRRTERLHVIEFASALGNVVVQRCSLGLQCGKESFVPVVSRAHLRLAGKSSFLVGRRSRDRGRRSSFRGNALGLQLGVGDHALGHRLRFADHQISGTLSEGQGTTDGFVGFWGRTNAGKAVFGPISARFCFCEFGVEGIDPGGHLFEEHVDVDLVISPPTFAKFDFPKGFRRQRHWTVTEYGDVRRRAPTPIHHGA